MRATYPIALACLLAALAPPVSAQNGPPVAWAEGVLGEAQPLDLVSTDLDVRTEGAAYQANLQMVFHNSSRSVVEGVCFLPIAAGAVERGFKADNNGQLMDSAVRSRDRVIRVYRNITRRSERQRDPVVLERMNDDWLRATISPVAPGADVTLTVSYLGLAERIGELRAIQLPVPATRGGEGGLPGYTLAAAVDGTEDGIALHVPDQKVRNLRYTEAGHEFHLTGRPEWDARSSLYFSDPHASDVLWSGCYREAGEDGYFLAEVNPSYLLEEPLASATYVFVVNMPEGTPTPMLGAAKGVLAEVIDQLPAGSRAAMLTNHSLGGSRGNVVPVTRESRDWLKSVLNSSATVGPERMREYAARAAELCASERGPVRWVVVNGARLVNDVSEVLHHVRAVTERQDDSSVFTLSIGRSDHDAMDRIAERGFGRAFHAWTEDHLPALTGTLAAAVQRPTLRAPVVHIAGATETAARLPQVLTFGDTATVTGRYHSGGATLVRLNGQVAGQSIDEVFGAVFEDDCQDHPWVATLWAARRVEDLQSARQERESEPMTYFETRLCERFGILGPTTAALALEPGMETRMPQLVGPGDPQVGVPGSPLVALGPRAPEPGLRPPTGAGDDGLFEREERAIVNALGTSRNPLSGNSGRPGPGPGASGRGAGSPPPPAAPARPAPSRPGVPRGR